jgi:hypothetical protein
MLYFAYGSNLCRAGMGARCPAAEALGRAALPDHRLVFRTWADIEPCVGTEVAGGLWRITPSCEAALDLYEDLAGGLYRRVLARVWREGAAEPAEALVYRMTATTREPPDPAYLATMLQGCRDFGLDECAILSAAAKAGAAGST